MNQLPRCQLEVGITPTEPTETIGTIEENWWNYTNKVLNMKRDKSKKRKVMDSYRKYLINIIKT